jgi:hypothetical protein
MTDRVHQPPPLSALLAAFKEDPNSKHLRLGQWFINRFMPDSMDGRLYVENDNTKILNMLTEYYQHYQWEF